MIISRKAILEQDPWPPVLEFMIHDIHIFHIKHTTGWTNENQALITMAWLYVESPSEARWLTDPNSSFDVTRCRQGDIITRDPRLQLYDSFYIVFHHFSSSLKAYTFNPWSRLITVIFYFMSLFPCAWSRNTSRWSFEYTSFLRSALTLSYKPLIRSSSLKIVQPKNRSAQQNLEIEFALTFYLWIQCIIFTALPFLLMSPDSRPSVKISVKDPTLRQ